MILKTINNLDENKKKEEDETILEVDGLKKYYRVRGNSLKDVFGFGEKRHVKAVENASFKVPRGKTLGIVGESGCGKSVTALSIMGLLPKPSAQIVNGKILFGF